VFVADHLIAAPRLAAATVKISAMVGTPRADPADSTVKNLIQAHSPKARVKAFVMVNLGWYRNLLVKVGKFPLGLVHQKRPPQVPKKQCFPCIL